MEDREEKMVEIARFVTPEEAHELESLLKSEGINCYVRNEYTTQVMGLANMGGVRVELLEGEVLRALEIMEVNGYDIPSEDEEVENIQVVSGWTRHIPFLRHYPLEKQIIILFILVAICLALFIYFGSTLSSK